jgi:hypothetical protein
MSEPYVATGDTRTVDCAVCGAPVEQQAYRGAYGSPPTWMTPSHVAPCGMACKGGPVRSSVHRAGLVHGDQGYPPGVYPATVWDEGGPYEGAPPRPCPACTGLPPVSTQERRAGVTRA